MYIIIRYSDLALMADSICLSLVLSTVALGGGASSMGVVVAGFSVVVVLI